MMTGAKELIEQVQDIRLKTMLRSFENNFDQAKSKASELCDKWQNEKNPSTESEDIIADWEETSGNVKIKGRNVNERLLVLYLNAYTVYADFPKKQ